MMPEKSPLVVSVQTMREMDRLASDRYGVTGLTLMENAGRGIAAMVAELPDSGPVLIACGKGNNGGDGFVAARYLARAGRRVQVVLLADPASVKGDASVNLGRIQELSIPFTYVREPRELAAVEELVRGSSLVVDALLGSGLKGPVSGLLADTITVVNGVGKPVLAVDLPSGMDGDSGAIMGTAIQAVQTGTLGALKRGLTVSPGRELAGEIRVLDIGFPEELRIWAASRGSRPVES